ncbi:MAG: replicative DNA helicase [Actinomycetota bacterium]|nr:replicative DNA helicase [Actinomycetota bacterium]
MADNAPRVKKILDDQLKDRIPPHNNEAEQSLLGSMIISSEVIAETADKISAQDFYRPTHQKIFEAITSLYTKGEAVDPITVAEELEATGQLEAVGGRAYIHTLINVVPTAANAKYYAEIVEKNSVIRSLIRAATDVVNMGYEGIDDIGLLIDEAESKIFSVSKRRISEKFAHIKELLKEGFEHIEKLQRRGAAVSGLPTGLTDLDEKTSGLHPSDLIVIAARPSMGKTSLVLSIAQHVAIEEKTPVAIFSLEMSRQQLAQRLLCSEARVDVQLLRSGRLASEDWRDLSFAAGRLAEAPLYIDDTPSITMMEVRAKARRLMAKHKLGLIVVDYLQLMQSRTRSESRQQEISEISRSLKILGRELDVPVIAVSQLSRAVESRTDKRPLLSDLRESGAIEQDADLVIFIYRDDYYNRDSDEKGIAEVILSKHRNGPTGTIKLAFLEQYTRFVNLAKGYD